MRPWGTRKEWGTDMPRPANPERIYRAQRAGLLARLRDAERLGELRRRALDRAVEAWRFDRR
jgi:hypothetical protein